MIDEFLKVAYAGALKQKEEAELEGLLRHLPAAELHKIANGTPVAELYGELDKTAMVEIDGSQSKSYLDRFKGTPLFEQAIALEQEELQADMQDMQQRQQRRAEGQNEGAIWDMKDKIRLRKRMLELDLAKQEAGGAPPGEPVQGAGAPGPVPSEGVQDNSQGLGGGVAKVGGVKEALSPGLIGKAVESTALKGGLSDPTRFSKALGLGARVASKGHELGGAVGNALKGQGQHLMDTVNKLGSSPEEKTAFADNMGRALARQDFEKAAHAQVLTTFGRRAGELMAKTALGMGDVTGMLGKAAPMAQKALGFAAKNKALTGAAIGAAGGALAGGPGNRLAGAAGGAALGGAAGVAAGGGGGMGEKLRGQAKSLLGAAPKPSGGRATMPGMGGDLNTPSLAPPNPLHFAQKDLLGRPKMAMLAALRQMALA